MTTRSDEQRAAPPDDGHMGSFTTPGDVMETASPKPGEPGVRPGAPALHTDATYAPQRFAWRGVLGGVVLAVLLGLAVFYTFSTAR
jgi:hypothetical protein